MLVQVTIENFLSFKEATTFSMLGVNSDFSHLEHLAKVIFLDELDRRLHPLISRKFLEFSLECKTEESKSQLIFTTHDTNLLDLDLLRRDEIWFVEKNQQGMSHIYSLAEFKIRPDLKIEKGYLNGRFGAIPFFGDIRSLFINAINNFQGDRTQSEFS